MNADALLTTRGLADLPLAREAMTERLRQRGFEARVVDAMGELPRHAFVGPNLLRLAYLELDLWTSDTLVLAPETVAMIAHSLELSPSTRVLEIGTGSGYQTAVLAACAGEVYSVDIVASCIAQAAEALGALGLGNTTLRWRDGSSGWPERGPFDAIVCDTAWLAAPAQLVDQLRPDGGRLILPLGPAAAPQRLTLLRRQDDCVVTTDLGSVFVTPVWPGPGTVGVAAVPVEGAPVDLPTEPTTEGAAAAAPASEAAAEEPPPRPAAAAEETPPPPAEETPPEPAGGEQAPDPGPEADGS